jgi:hypothetical protein
MKGSLVCNRGLEYFSLCSHTRKGLSGLFKYEKCKGCCKICKDIVCYMMRQE